jgi:hypothetical protein
MSKEDLKWLEWKDEDFVVEKIKKEEWDAYKNKFPNLAWGTCIIRQKDDEIIVQRFIDKETCLRYCTAPTCCDFGIGIGKSD